MFGSFRLAFSIGIYDPQEFYLRLRVENVYRNRGRFDHPHEMLLGYAEEKARAIKAEIRRLRKEPNSVQNKRAIRQLYNDLDEVQFKPDYMCLIIDKNKDYYRACQGFSINGMKYRRLLGTNGGIKNETIVFVGERHWEELVRRIDNGRDMTKEMVPAKLEAYKALTCSAWKIPAHYIIGGD